jgi:hypothetical protein
LPLLPLLPQNLLRHLPPQHLLSLLQLPPHQLQLRKKKRKLTRKQSPLKVSLPRKTHLKLKPRPLHQPQLPSNLEEDDGFVVDDEVTFGRNRQSLKFGELIHDDELSDYVKDRLALARMLALMKYRQVNQKAT